MNKVKRKRLQRKGWKVGNAKEFLGLSDEETRYIDLKLELSRRLRERREACNLTQVEFAHQLQSSQSRVAKMEAGDPSVSLDLLVRSLFALGTSRRDLAQFISAPNSAQGYKGKGLLRALATEKARARAP